MRNLKKLISLVLVVAMIASLCVAGMFSASAAEEVSQYPDAAAVITALGVMEGDEGGMRYGDTVTREEAATIVCRLLLSPSVAKLLSKTVNAPYEDTTGWSAGYVAYLKEKNVVNGVSATQFNPKGNVTGLQFAKMLLTALGYGKAGEYVGASWDINTIVDANTQGIFTGTTAADLTAPATREECMLYAFNAMFRPTVVYSKDTASYVPQSLDGKPKTLANNMNVIPEAGGADAFGRPTIVYTVGRTQVAPVDTNQLVGTFASLNSDILYTALGDKAVKTINAALEKDPHAVTIFVDGVDKSADYSVTAIKKGQIGYNTKILNVGGTAELYFDGEALTIVIYYEHIGPAAVSKTGAVSVDGKEVKIAAKAGDMVIYTIAVDTIQSAKIAEPVVGTYSSFTSGSYTIGGQTYILASTKVNEPEKSIDALGKDLYVYTNSYGQILAVAAVGGPEAEVLNDYVFVLRAEAAKQAGPGDSLLNPTSGSAGKLVVQVAYATGNIANLNYQVKADKDGKSYVMFDNKAYPLTTDEEVDNVLKAIGKGWRAYKVNDDATVVLTMPNAAYARVAASDVDLKAGTITVDGMYANGATVLNIVSDKGKLTTKTGYLNFAKVTAPAEQVLLTYAKNSKTISAINIFNGTVAEDVKPISYAFLKAAGATTVDGTEYTFILTDGTESKIAATEELTIGAIYTIEGKKFTKTDLKTTKDVFISDPATLSLVALPDHTVAAAEQTYFITVGVPADPDAGIEAIAPITYVLDSKCVVTDTTGAGKKSVEKDDVFILAQNDSGYVTNIWIVG